MLNSSWCRVGEKVGLKQVRAHNLKHIFGRRLTPAGVSFEDRKDLTTSQLFCMCLMRMLA